MEETQLEVLKCSLSNSIVNKVLEAKNIDLKDKNQVDKERATVLQTIQSMDVRDPAEAMLISGMIMSYDTASECLNRAHNLKGKEMSKYTKLLDKVIKFSRLYKEQLLALQTYRSPSSRVRVDHVNVYHKNQPDDDIKEITL